MYRHPEAHTYQYNQGMRTIVKVYWAMGVVASILLALGIKLFLAR